MHGPKYKKNQLIFLHNPATPQGWSPQLHSFWRGPYQILKGISDLTYKVHELATIKELIVHYDRMKPCRMPPEGISATQTTPQVSHPQKGPSPAPLRTSPCMCEVHILIFCLLQSLTQFVSPRHSCQPQKHPSNRQQCTR